MSKYLITLILKSPNLNNSQFKTIVDICINLGTISLGSVAIPLVFDKKFDLMLSFGLIGAFSFWYLAVYISRKIYE
ncbi:hypothetical protein A2130_01455 [Candidatus Woesebacteria bacterium GWC2_33_12]|uniref:Uncharacterized protein n=1 Tax=Candidatus Woesebacteria bacterium GW2011_GWB1_33_22 TaxID=1618566 RepID=A0A0G0C103_9BACT|nr:MAG: hypothetical protein UR29_C0007G0010 [Candidatus Woesebacteria bacterium GW2011_GWC2_33_12]KKP42146.1 MAG: hypothetical protein UR33_C0005G0010 [Candidatus Woesebacteria bacterium GW2011_GWA2_33_20]KKP44880.1 MAG: hypothetical protein UR35_C0005G0010 [Candidatus Woesebacteria bacterium GW2011_GWB1_33_22]KKP46694.1 MAG: hypothetical protein UR37_C0005G0010 [Microgenomates group bacterium GW2011_GWC1_33_28]KKP50594.1 MAG: hypothetical protein UR41_C0005G0010 [Candidatus Woesebacteria bact